MPWSETKPMDQRMMFLANLESCLYTMTELCARFGISRKTGYKWATRYAAEGVQGLPERSRAPHHCPHRSDPEVIQALLAARQKRPTWGPRKPLAKLEREEPDRAWPAPSTAGDILKRAGLVPTRQR